MNYRFVYEENYFILLKKRTSKGSKYSTTRNERKLFVFTVSVLPIEFVDVTWYDFKEHGNTNGGVS